MDGGIRGPKRFQGGGTHHLSRGISTLEKIAAEDHSDYDTWTNLNQPVEVCTESIPRRTSGTEHDLHGERNVERIYPVVEERTGCEEEDLSCPMRNGGLTWLQGWKSDAPTRLAPFDEIGQGLDGDEEHLGESERGAYFWSLPKELLVCPHISEGTRYLSSAGV